MAIGKSIEKLRLSEAEEKDIDSLIDIGKACALSPWSEQNYVDEMAREDSVILKLSDASESTVGFIVGRIFPGMGAKPTPSEAEIYNLGVLIQYRRGGHATRLLDAFLDRCSDANTRSVWLEVRSSNVAAIDFYRQNGFMTVSRRPSLYSDPVEDGLTMALRIVSE